MLAARVGPREPCGVILGLGWNNRQHDSSGFHDGRDEESPHRLELPDLQLGPCAGCESRDELS
jgi:hypothetical protein